MRESGRRTAARKSSRKGERVRDMRGTDGDADAEGTEESGGRQKGGSRILTERWGMSRRVVCSHGSSLGTAVQYAGQGKVTLLCVRACARARLLTVPHTIACIRVYIRDYTVALSL